MHGVLECMRDSTCVRGRSVIFLDQEILDRDQGEVLFFIRHEIARDVLSDDPWAGETGHPED